VPKCYFAACFCVLREPKRVAYSYLAFTDPYFLPLMVTKNSRADCIEMCISDRMLEYFLPFGHVRSSKHDAGTFARSTVSVATRKTDCSNVSRQTSVPVREYSPCQSFAEAHHRCCRPRGPNSSFAFRLAKNYSEVWFSCALLSMCEYLGLS
jgi:hypothetical protein